MSDQDDRPNPLKQVIEALGAIAGVTALVYVGGGAIYYVRLSLYGIEGVTVTSALPREFLISVGVLGLVGPWFLGVCLFVVAGFWWGSKSGVTDWIRRLWSLALMLPVTVALAGAAVVLRSDGHWSWTLGWIVGISSLVFFALWATLVRIDARLGEPKPGTYFDRPALLFRRAALHGLAFVPAGFTLAAGLPLQAAEVCPVSRTSTGSQSTSDALIGRFLGQSNERVWLAEVSSRDGDDGPRRIAAVPWSASSRIYIYPSSDQPPAC